MISSEVQSALLDLQHRNAQARDLFEIDRIERALDEIVRNAENTSPARHQVRSAMANASKMLKKRRSIVVVSLEQYFANGHGEPDRDEPGYMAVELKQWIDSLPSVSDRILLNRLAAGADVAILAREEDVPEQRIRERIARARRRAKTDLAAVQAA
jgi:DNA-directed RNA polymerase specialized sigma24 family protein